MDMNRSKQKTTEGLKDQATRILDRFYTESDFMEEALTSTVFVYKLGLSNVYPALLMNGQVYGSSQVSFFSIDLAHYVASIGSAWLSDIR